MRFQWNRIVRSLLVAGVVTLSLLCSAQPLAAQAAPKQDEDPFGSVLFPPELIMQHARAINLDDRQRATITKLIEQLQGRAVRLQWQLAEQAQALKQTLSRTMVDQDRALDQMNRVLEVEKEIKKAHLEMLIQIKNVLRADQQTELTRLRVAAAAAKAPKLER
jgi:Spy/CpxP family protein refolding chaperone